PIRKNPNQTQFVLFLIKITAHKIRAKFRWLCIVEQWNIGTVDIPVSKLLDFDERPKVNWLPQAKAIDFIADPMSIVWRGKILTLAERWLAQQAKGQIVELEDSALNRNLVRIAITESHHLSYPYLFEYNGKLYCIPESATANEIAVYELEEPSKEWQKK